jgi:hypothetical protein
MLLLLLLLPPLLPLLVWLPLLLLPLQGSLSVALSSLPQLLSLPV